MPPDDLTDQFASTYEELHYLLGGLCAGFVLGWVGHALFHHSNSHD